MHVRVISLQRAKARRAKIKATLDGLNTPFEFIDATEGQLLTDADRALVDHTQRQKVSPYLLSDNEIGCALSHRRAMEYLLTTDQAAVVILEDDADVHPDLIYVMQAVVTRKIDFDFIFLGRAFKKGEMFIPTCELAPNLQLGRVGYMHLGAIGYIVSRKGAENFLHFAPRIIHAVDKEIHRYWANGLDLYGLSHPVVTCADEGHSFLDETRHHAQPTKRQRYPDANQLVWRFRRRLTSINDSIMKRVAFVGLVLRDLIKP